MENGKKKLDDCYNCRCIQDEEEKSLMGHGSPHQNKAMPIFGGAWNGDIPMKMNIWLKRGAF